MNRLSLNKYENWPYFRARNKRHLLLERKVDQKRDSDVKSS